MCIATTVYESPDASYVFSIQDSREALHKEGFQTAYYLLQGNCHVDDARNRVCQEFLKSDCTHLVFIDADVCWEAKDLVRLAKHDADFVGGVYPYRRKNKENDMPVRQMAGAVCSHGLIEVEGLPAGFTKISRKVIEAIAEKSDFYIDDEGNKFHVMFQRTLESGTRWGGDLHFCNLWRDCGGKLYADYEMVLGHTGKVTHYGSLASFNRRKFGTTLLSICAKVRAGSFTAQDLREARDYVDNEWGAKEPLLATAIKLARESNGPILECGSGLSTILMAAATRRTVFCLEHHGLYAAKLRQMAAEAKSDNIGLCVVPITDGFYDAKEFRGLPDAFNLAILDGPPRQAGDRMKFFDMFGRRVKTILVDDVDSLPYRGKVMEWAESNGREFTLIDQRTAVIQ